MNEQAKERIQAALPAYEIADELGRGAFGVVYEARHSQLGRQVAIKQLPQSFAENDEVRERFVAEAQMVASLEHPHIVPVYDFVESDGSRFLIMERCEGSVGDRFKQEGIVTDEACAAVLACLSALDFAHEKGLLHRDVKPENLMYDTKGVIKLGDFGIARDLGEETRRTATGMIIGTPAYMSPEQCRGDDLTAASDVYSVAVMGYELLTGALPFPATDSVNGLLAHHLVTEPTPLLQTRPELPGSVGEVIDRALTKDLTVRYGTAVEFATALARACVTAFGSGWLRRRRFILHWPAIIAETERSDSNSPRTGTIMVRAGDVPHAIVADAEVIEPTAQLQPEAPAASSSSADAPTLPEQPVAPQTVADLTPPTASPSSAANAQQAAPAEFPTSASFGADDPEQAKSGPNWLVLGGIAAAVAAVIIGVLAFGGGSDTNTLTANEVDPAPTASLQQDEPTAVPEQAEPTPEPQQADDPTPVPEADAEPEPTTPPEPTAPPLNSTGQPEQPFVQGTNGNPILNRLPLEFDDSLTDSPWNSTPCPLEQELVACFIGVIDATAEDDDNLSATWFSLGFTPQLEPTAGEHLHFYIPEIIDGDETKAGTATPGGAWKDWDGPWPATSFGGDGGRTLYTMADFRAVDSTTMCVIVATADHEAIPGSGNCAPVVSDADFDNDTYFFAVDRLEGQWVGSCADRVTAIAPEDWRWYSMSEFTPAELAAVIRPTAIAETTALLETFVAQGGVLWAEGPAINDFIVNMAFSIIPGEFGLTDSPSEVAESLTQLGVPTSGGGSRTVSGRDLYFERTNVGGNLAAAKFVVPDFGYAIAMTMTAPAGQGLSELADQIAYTINGC